jgi:beta-glucanase (GH16 family)
MPAWTVLPFALIAAAACSVWADPPGHAEWELVFEDQFDGTDADLERNWKFRNGPSDHILCSRWRENAVLDNGILKLVAKKETRAGQDWTAASLWTKQRFQYGYFECRYRYAPTTGTNNSFWIITLEPRSKDGSTPNLFEIDINEGHYPDEVNMNLHNRSGKHWSKGGRWYANDGPRASGKSEAGKSFELAHPMRGSRLRIVSHDSRVRIAEVRVFPPSAQGYPSVFPSPMEAQPDVENLASAAKAESSSNLNAQYTADKVLDGKLTAESQWVSGKGKEPHVLTLDFGRTVDMGCVQFISGWFNEGAWQSVVSDFAAEVWNGKDWRPVPGASSTASHGDEMARAEELKVNLGKTFHVYGLEWTETDLIYYFDGQEIRRQPHTICHRPAPVWLSLAIIRWAGTVTDDIDGKSMDVDYVRVYRKKR